MGKWSPSLDQLARSLWDQRDFSFIPAIDCGQLEGSAQQRGTGPRVVFAGFPSDYSLAFLLALLRLDVCVVGLITSPGAHPAILGHNALSRIADHIGVPLIRAWRVNDEHVVQDLRSLQPDAVVMASFDQIIRTRMLRVPVHGWMNVHPSALPARRGPEPVYWTIAGGDGVGGITLHRAAPRFDAGNVLAQAMVPVGDDDTSGTLARRLCEEGTALLDGALRRLLADDEGEALDLSVATYAPAVGHRPLASAPSAVEALRTVRAGMPNMPAWIEVAGEVCYVRAAHLGDGEGPHLSFPDGDVTIDAMASACGCHHDLVSCPHREA